MNLASSNIGMPAEELQEPGDIQYDRAPEPATTTTNDQHTWRNAKTIIRLSSIVICVVMLGLAGGNISDGGDSSRFYYHNGTIDISCTSYVSYPVQIIGLAI